MEGEGGTTAGVTPGPTVGLVLVSHSRSLAEGAAELARAMAGEEVQIVPAGGMEPPETALGTDATRVAAAIEKAWSRRGVLVLMDLGSALLSAEMALEFVTEEHRQNVVLSSAPLVEGAVAAAIAARLGNDLDQVRSEAMEALSAKAAQLEGADRSETASGSPPTLVGEALELIVPVNLPLGLHARPAARVVLACAGLNAQVVASNASTGDGPVAASSFNALARLQIRSGQELRVQAVGPDAARAIEAIRQLAERRFDEPEDAALLVPSADAPPAVRPRQERRQGELVGLAASPGTVVGPVLVLGEAEYPISEELSEDPAEEMERLQAALVGTRLELEALREATRVRAGPYEAAIVDALLLFLSDPELLDPTREGIEARHETAAKAWSVSAARAEAELREMDDARMRTRAVDLEGVSRKVLARLCGVGQARLSGQGVLVAEELTPTDTAGLDRTQVLGLATAGEARLPIPRYWPGPLEFRPWWAWGPLSWGSPPGPRYCLTATEVSCSSIRRPSWCEMRSCARNGRQRRRPRPERPPKSQR